VAEVIRRFGPRVLQERGDTLSQTQRQALRDLARCRTAALGGHVRECEHCGHRQVCYNSCRNRNCPACQGGTRAKWLEARREELLPVEYFHVVFTLPAEVAEVAFANQRLLYDLLFSAASQTLLEVAADPKHLGAKIGFQAVLHTWGQNLMHHPHLHCLVPGGGLSEEGSQWVRCPRGFFLPVKVLSRVFRGKFLQGLKRAYDQGQLFLPQGAAWSTPAGFCDLLNRAYRQEWLVYAKPPSGSAEQTLKYLARYTHRTAIANSRLIAVDEERVSFRWKDYAHGGKTKTMTLSGEEFLRRFLMHVLPKGLVRTRSYGFLANRHRREQLALCRRLLNAAPLAAARAPSDSHDDLALPPCPVCGQCAWRAVELVTRDRGEAVAPALEDSS
jgi:hypothetical protein